MQSPETTPLPRVAVLMASYNGRRWIPDQVRSILNQRGVSVRLVIADDHSQDGTAEWLAELAATEPRVTLLHNATPSGGAAANFYRLLRTAAIEPDELVALSDQDDLWAPDKLARHAALIAQRGYAAVSSSITSFTADGKRTLVRKGFPQRAFDFLTESPGPGSTFLMTQPLLAVVRTVLVEHPEAAGADYHDSLVYAVARSHGLPWHIDPTSTVDYRQHDHNVMGSNVGVGSALTRLELIRSHWHRGQATLHARVGLHVASPQMRPGLERMLALMTTPGIRSRFALARAAGQLRRRPRDRAILGLLIAAGIW